ncbi:MAG: ABC transporter permease subunit [Candidatus Kariarchaeaceae archaeon]
MEESVTNSEKSSLFTKLRLADYIVIAFLFLPWSIISSSSVIQLEDRTTEVDVDVWQWWFGRYVTISSDGETESRWEILGSAGGPLYSIFFFMAIVFFIHAIYTRLRYFKSDEARGTYGSDLFFVWFFATISSILMKRDAHDFAYGHVGISWGYETTDTYYHELIAISKNIIIPYALPIIIIPVFFAFFYEARNLTFAWWDSVSNVVRFFLLGFFTIISVFPLIWVFIVSINTQTTIKSGFALWPLDRSKPVSWDSYTRFFLFEGKFMYAGFLTLVIVTVGYLVYHQVSHAGKWLDKIQNVIYTRVSAESANNNNTTLAYWGVLFFQLAILILALALIFTIGTVLGIPGAEFRWFLRLADDAGGQTYPVGNWFFITTIICAGVSFAGLFMSCLAAYAMSRYEFPGKSSFVSIVLSTQMFPGIILLLPLLVMWKTMELTDSIFGLSLAYATFAVPFATFMLKGYFDSIPQDLEEAAMVDGCTRLGAFTRVILPLSLPGLASTFLFTFLTGYTEYLLALTLYGGDSDHYTISLALINVFRVDYQNYYFPDLALFSIIVAAPILLMFVYLQRFLIAGLVAGGTKG